MKTLFAQNSISNTRTWIVMVTG